MIEIHQIITVVWLHFLADFVFQTRTTARNKSKNNWYLILHCVLYGVPFTIIGWKYSLVNMFLHYIVDYCSSRLAGVFHRQNREYLFFNTIGCDQAMHITVLVLTLSVEFLR